jgi:signal transduction histidine kinase
MLAVLREDDTALPHDPAPRLAQIPALVERVEAAGLPVTLTTSADCGAVPEGVQLAAYRIVQEALTNCLKHAHAGRAEVRLTCDHDTVQVEVVDDGEGPSSIPARAGHGLIGMRERVAVYGGELQTGSATGGGFRVWARLPLHAEVEVR